MLTRFTLAAVLATALLPGAARAQTSGTDHAAHAATSATTGPAEDAFRAANDAMHAGMDIAYSGDADIDFARGMIAHHEGAVAMARIVMELRRRPRDPGAWPKASSPRRRPRSRGCATGSRADGHRIGDNSRIRLFLRQIGAT
jgi:hypothetical protein